MVTLAKSTQLTKSQIRSKILMRLKNQKEEDRNRKSLIIKEKLFRNTVFKKAKKVMFYIAFGGEVDTAEMIKAAKGLGKIVAIPVCKKDKITLKPCILPENAKLKKGVYGICEPEVRRFMGLRSIDLIIVPGLAFDKKGNRLGRGKGCYDRFLSGVPKGISSVGLAYDFQILPNIPTAPHDVRVNRVIFA